MIIFLTTAAHGYTTKGLFNMAAPRPPLQHRTYGWLFKQPKLSAGAVVFTDVDRLPYEFLRRAERIAVKLSQSGVHVLNRPGQVRGRFDLLRFLYDEGLNPVQVWRADERPRIDRRYFPVFLKSESAHSVPFGGLIDDQAELDARIENLRESGVPPSHVLVTRFQNEEDRPGVWRRFTVYRIGPRLFPGLSVIEDKPFVKYGRYGLAEQEDFELCLKSWRENWHSDWAEKMFRAGCIDYGRADFGVVDGQPVLYEINTNPDIPYKHRSRDASYLQASRATQRLVANAMTGLDRPDIEVDLSKVNTRPLAI